MGNVMDYLDWRGDLPFGVSPMCEADELILACLSYVQFDGIVPGIGEGEITLQEAARQDLLRLLLLLEKQIRMNRMAKRPCGIKPLMPLRT